MYLKCRQFLILHFLFLIFKIYLLILLVTDNQGITIYCTSGKGLFICFKFVDRYYAWFWIYLNIDHKMIHYKKIHKTMQLRIYMIIKFFKFFLNKSSCKKYVLLVLWWFLEIQSIIQTSHCPRFFFPSFFMIIIN